MQKTVMKLSSLLLIMLVLSLVTVDTAQANDGTTRPGSGQKNALRPANGFVRIEAGQWQWYHLRAQVPFVSENGDAKIEAFLHTQSDDLKFEVWSIYNLNRWHRGESFKRMGAGIKNNFLEESPLYWNGSFILNRDFYLIVMNQGNQPADYSLRVTGDVRALSELTLPTRSQPARATVHIASDSGRSVNLSAKNKNSVKVQAGTGPQNALAPVKGIVRIEPRQWQWYLLRAQAGTRTDAYIDIAMQLQSGNAGFEVWSIYNLNKWHRGEPFKRMGAGTRNDSLLDSPFYWSGSFILNRDFYLIVMNGSDQPAHYSLQVTGDVRFPTK